MALTKSKIWKFTDLERAESFAARSLKGMMVILGCDELYWVVTMADGERLIRAGYEVA